MPRDNPPFADALIVAALTTAAAKTDADFLRIARIRKRRDGCCAVAALFLANKVFVLNVGDSRAVFFKHAAPAEVCLGLSFNYTALCCALHCKLCGTQAQALTVDHKPELASEKARIEAVGGTVLK